MTTTDLSMLAATLRATVRASRLARIPVEDLRQAALNSDLSFIGSPDARERLLAAIRELEATGQITLPRGRNGWESLPRPALPRWVARPPHLSRRVQWSPRWRGTLI
jgi:CRP-like cAMP-binding protein